jgi:hypothetical protein
MYIWLLAAGHKPSLKPPYSLIYKPLASAGADSEQKMSDAELPRQVETDDVEASEGKDASSGWMSTYISRSWQALSPQQRKDVAKRVLRYYVLLILPIALALAAIVAESTRVLMRLVGRLRAEDTKAWEPFVLLFAVWWLLDMAFVWVSPRSYEQYYLPLNASAAMLGGCCIALWRDRLLTRGGPATSSNTAVLDAVFFGIWIVAAAFVVSKVFRALVPEPAAYSQFRAVLIAAVIFSGLAPVALLADKLGRKVGTFRWGLAGAIALVCLLVMCWHVLFGIGTSPHSGVVYHDRSGEPEKRRGYAQKMHEVSGRLKQNWKAPWETVGQYIGARCRPEDVIYVWGWVPGIYVEAQKLCPAPKAFEGNMHIHPPHVLSRIVGEILASFEKNPPRCIVDTHKSHFPWDRPPLELWPMTRGGPLPNDEEDIRAYDNSYMQWLRKNVDEEEAQRYETMRPLREYVMNNYSVVVRREFGQHVLFERK